MGKLRKNSFVEGTVIAYLAIVFTKILGALYAIPFYAIIGESGGVIYACAYNVYAVFLTLSTSGIPNAVSILVSEYHSLHQQWAKERVRLLTTAAITAVSVLSFAVMFIFAEQIGGFFLKNTPGRDITMAIRTISFCLLIVPHLSIERGYQRGHAFIAPSSYSEVIEQLIRILIVLAGSFAAIRLFGFSVAVGVSVALSGAVFGALAALLYLLLKEKRNKEAFISLPEPAEGSEPAVQTEDDGPSETELTDRYLFRRIFAICIPIVIVSLATDLYNLTDMKLIMIGLDMLGYAPAEGEIAASVAATWGPKICMIISALAIGLSASIVPHIVDSNVKDDQAGVNRKFNQALNTVIVIAMPMTAGMILLAGPLYYIFYGASDYGPTMMLLLPVVAFLSSMSMVAGMAMQSIGRAGTVCAATLTGVTLNAALDLPLILLFGAAGLPAYLGASAASIIGQLIVLGIMMGVLKKERGFDYRPIRSILGKTLIFCLIMSAAVCAMKLVVPTEWSSYLMRLLILCVYAAAGAAVYLVLAWRSHTLQEILGDDFIRKILDRLPGHRSSDV